MPAFYNHPQSVDDIVDHVVVRILDQFDLPALDAKRWDGIRAAREIHSVA
jgi:4-hydroxy-3-polyprenylbenzoate decarboxylase